MYLGTQRKHQLGATYWQCPLMTSGVTGQIIPPAGI